MSFLNPLDLAECSNQRFQMKPILFRGGGCQCGHCGWRADDFLDKHLALRAVPMVETMHSFYSCHISKKLSIETISPIASFLT